MLMPVFLFLAIEEDSYYEVVTNDLLRSRLSRIAYSIEQHSLNREKAISAICGCSILTTDEAEAVICLLEKECSNGTI